MITWTDQGDEPAHDERAELRRAGAPAPDGHRLGRGSHRHDGSGCFYRRRSCARRDGRVGRLRELRRRSGVGEPGDTAATADDILDAATLFGLGVAALYLAALLDVVVAWSLFPVSPVNAELSRLDPWLRLAYAALFLVALSHLAGIPSLLET